MPKARDTFFWVSVGEHSVCVEWFGRPSLERMEKQM